jgi:hypothetical protein
MTKFGMSVMPLEVTPNSYIIIFVYAFYIISIETLTSILCRGKNGGALPPLPNISSWRSI